MSKRANSAFASKSMFDVLGQDDDDIEDVESEDEQANVPAESSTTSSSTAPSAPLTKSARKRLNKQARAASASNDKSGSGSETVQEAVPSAKEVQKEAAAVAETTQEKATSVVNGVKATLTSTVNGAAASLPTSVEEIKDQAAKVAGDAKATLDKAAEAVSPRSIGSSFTPVPEKPYTPSTNGERKSSFSQPPSTKFAPDLPEDLPEPKGDALPANRKRKTPKEFGSASSPTKLGVKFEDGVAPGEGKVGEKVIKPKARQNVVERTVMTFVMIAGFIVLLCAGHPFMIMLVLVCQTLVYKEITALFDLRDEGKKKIGEGDAWNKTLNWYFFVVTNYFLYGESIIYYFKHIVFVDAYFIPFATNHRFISFMLYIVGFVGFVGNLNKQYLRQQFALFCWVHITLLLTVVSSHFIVNNILEGHVWFFVPASLVICNDVMAYVCGKAFGRTPLIKLSPKKTVEGFVGAFICTLLFALLWGTFFMRFPYMICPAHDLGTNVFSDVVCRPNPVFMWRDFEFSGAARKLLETVLGHAPPAIPYAPFQIHCLVMATFASLFAPFGGFFASGFKRAFNIKDFGDSIPGHGGMTDRMDCQFMMGLFSYVYYSSLIRIQYVTVGSVMQTVVTSLSGAEQLELLSDLKRFLEGQGVRVGK